MLKLLGFFGCFGIVSQCVGICKKCIGNVYGGAIECFCGFSLSVSTCEFGLKNNALEKSPFSQRYSQVNEAQNSPESGDPAAILIVKYPFQGLGV